MKDLIVCLVQLSKGMWMLGNGKFYFGLALFKSLYSTKTLICWSFFGTDTTLSNHVVYWTTLITFAISCFMIYSLIISLISVLNFLCFYWTGGKARCMEVCEPPDQHLTPACHHMTRRRHLCIQKNLNYFILNILIDMDTYLYFSHFFGSS